VTTKFSPFEAIPHRCHNGRNVSNIISLQRQACRFAHTEQLLLNEQEKKSTIRGMAFIHNSADNPIINWNDELILHDALSLYTLEAHQ
jgi:hypothetical protein